MRVTLYLPEPPTMNTMLDYAKRRTKRTHAGGWLKGRALPIVYDHKLKDYELLCEQVVRMARTPKPEVPWAKWRLLELHFRLHAARDWLELAAGAKWVVDYLVSAGFIAGDSPREMERPEAWPTQEITRRNRGVTITIEEVL